jgi:hypothetical protein
VLVAELQQPLFQLVERGVGLFLEIVFGKHVRSPY